MNTQLTLQDVINQLIREGFSIPEGYQDVSSELEEMEREKKESTSPWYVRFFVHTYILQDPVDGRKGQTGSCVRLSSHS